MENKPTYVIGGTELGRAPMLKKCPCCKGIADYMKRATPLPDGRRNFVRCSECGMSTGLYHWPQNAGEAWNQRASEQPRVITLDEIAAFRADLTDDRGRTACWLETIEGDLAALVIEASTSMEGREVYECGYGDYWPREKVDAEGIRWRLWDKKPKNEDCDREPWGRVAWQVMSDAARAEAERIRRQLDERAAREAEKRLRAERRRCLYCANYVPVDTEGVDMGAATPFVCALDGHLVENRDGRCEQWTDIHTAEAAP